MVRKSGYLSVSERKLVKWVRIAGNISVLQRDIQKFSYREFNVKYGETYGKNVRGEKNKEESFRATIRRMKVFLPQKKEVFKAKKFLPRYTKKQLQPLKNVYEGFEDVKFDRLKNVWRLKKGKRKESYQQVNLVVKYKVLQMGKVIVSEAFVTISSGVSFKKTLEELKEKVWKKYIIWLKRMSQSKKNVRVLSKTTQVFRFLR